MRSNTIEDDPLLDLDVRQTNYQLPVHALYLSAEVYVNCPWFQRHEVWPGEYKFQFMKSLIRGSFIPAILTTPMPGDRTKKWVIDGQQRLKTILEFMAALECDLQHRPIPRHPGGKEFFYFKLSDRQQQRFMSALVQFTDLFEVNEEQLSIIFLDLQNQMTLKTAERLWSMAGRMREVAAHAMTHRYFQEIYDGKTQRMQSYQMAMYPAALEMYRPFADMSGSRLLDLAKRKQGDKLLSGTAEQDIFLNLDGVCHLFAGIRSSAMTEIIIQYQAVWFLRFLGVNVEGSQEGALVEWYREVERMNSDYRRRGFMNLFAQFTQAKVQKLHWQRWLEDILYNHPGLHLGDDREVLAQMQRVTGWLRNNGVCPECNNVHVQLSQVKQHVFRPADAHDPTLQSCKEKSKIVRSGDEGKEVVVHGSSAAYPYGIK